MVCKLAEFVVEFKNIPLEITNRFSAYKSFEQPQASFEITQSDIEYEIQAVGGKSTHINAVLAAFLRKLVTWAIDYKALFLHSSLIEVDGVGVAFLAPSGTGKTTHTLLWKKLLGDRMTIINGDKPIVRFFENIDNPIGYGTPWNGKERYGCNLSVPIKHLCFIERADTNSCERMEPSEALQLFFKQIYIPKTNAVSVYNGLSLADEFLSKVDVWKIKCNMDIKAAEIAYNRIFKK